LHRPGGGHDLTRCGEGEDAPAGRRGGDLFARRGPPPGGGGLGRFSAVVRRRNGVLSHVGRRGNYLVWSCAGDAGDAPAGRRGGVHFRRGPPLGPPWGAGSTGMMMVVMPPARPRSWLR